MNRGLLCEINLKYAFSYFYSMTFWELTITHLLFENVLLYNLQSYIKILITYILYFQAKLDLNAPFQ